MIELSVMEHGREFPQLLRDLLDQFERVTKLKVNLRLLTWQHAWAELMRVGLYNDGAHVSEIGSTWLSEFVGMSAVQPFGPSDLARAMVADTRLIYYRPDVFERAGVDLQRILTRLSTNICLRPPGDSM